MPSENQVEDSSVDILEVPLTIHTQALVLLATSQFNQKGTSPKQVQSAPLMLKVRFSNAVVARQDYDFFKLIS